MRLCHNLAKCIMFVMFLSKSINKQRYPKTAIVALKKTNRFQSGFRDACRFFQTDQTVNRKKSGFRACIPILRLAVYKEPGSSHLLTQSQFRLCFKPWSEGRMYDKEITWRG